MYDTLSRSFRSNALRYHRRQARQTQVEWECLPALLGSTIGGALSRNPPPAPPPPPGGGVVAIPPIGPPGIGLVLRRMFAFTGPGRPRPMVPPPPSRSPSPPWSSGAPPPPPRWLRTARATGGRKVACKRHTAHPRMPENCSANM